MPERALPSTFPSDPSAPERAELRMVYLPLRGSYISLRRSRGQFRGRTLRQDEEISDQSLQPLAQSEHLRQLLDQEPELKAQSYAMPELVTDVIEQLEDAGDELSKGFGAYQLGKRRPGGGSAGCGSSGLMAAGASMPRLIKGVLHFLNRWRVVRQRFAELNRHRDSLHNLLEDADG